MPTVTQPARTDTRMLILSSAVALFAESGYASVSMRDIANSLNISASALYHHFPDKQTLYLEAIRHSFRGKAEEFSEALAPNGPAEIRLKRFISRFCKLVKNDRDFDRLMHRELLDGNKQRLKLLADNVFKEQFTAICRLVEELAPNLEPHLATVSILGLVIYHLECQPLRKYLPGAKPEHEDPDAIAHHVMRILTKGLH